MKIAISPHEFYKNFQRRENQYQQLIFLYTYMEQPIEIVP